MGIETEILHTLAKEWCNGCVHPGVPMHDRPMVLIDDSMTKVRNKSGPSFDGSFTGKEFFEMMINPIRKCLGTGRYLAAVCCVDQPAFVPPEKYATQAGRDQESKLQPYPWQAGEYVLINDEGIRFSPTEPFEAFHAGRLFLTRALRDKLWQYVQFRFTHEHFPEGTTAILDYSLEGPLINDDGPPRHIPALRHDFGEGEIACLVWARVFHHYPVLVRTIDSDFLPLSLSFLATQEPRRVQPLYWMYKEDFHMDMIECHRLLGTQMKWSVFDFILAVSLCGSDYTDKPLLTHMVGWRYIFYVIQRVKDEPFWLNVHRFSWHLERFLSILYTTYTSPRDEDGFEMVEWQELLMDPTHKQSTLPSLESLREAFKRRGFKRFRVPDHLTVQKGLKQIRFLLGYWIRDFNGIGTMGLEALKDGAVCIDYVDTPEEAMTRALENIQTVYSG